MSLFSFSWEKFKKVYGPLVLGYLIVAGIGIMFGMVRGLIEAAGSDGPMFDITPYGEPIFRDPGPGDIIGIPLRIIEQLVAAVLNLGFVALMLDVWQGKPVNPTRVLSQIPKLGKLIVVQLVGVVVTLVLFGIPIALGAVLIVSGEDDAGILIALLAFILFSVPAIYVLLGLFFATYELAYDDTVGPIDAIKRSWQLADGHRWAIFGSSFLAAGALLIGFLMCCVGLLGAVPFVALFQTGLFVALRNGAGLPPGERSEPKPPTPL